MQPSNVPVDNLDVPGHPRAALVTVFYGPADHMCSGVATTIMRIHATDATMGSVLAALLDGGMQPLTEAVIRDCQPRFGCFHPYLICLGDLTDIDIRAGLLAVQSGTGPLPIVIPKPPGYC